MNLQEMYSMNMFSEVQHLHILKVICGLSDHQSAHILHYKWKAKCIPAFIWRAVRWARNWKWEICIQGQCLILKINSYLWNWQCTGSRLKAKYTRFRSVFVFECLEMCVYSYVFTPDHILYIWFIFIFGGCSCMIAPVLVHWLTLK